MIAESKVNGGVTSRCLNCQGYRGGFQISLPGTFSPSDIRHNNVVKFEDFVCVMLLKHKPAMTNELK